ncbi:MAG: phosphoheptose isomerase [Idiomarinaceae bacterium]|uniref:Phosphoheptose isomerase n=1 Tax=Pseudidiomarina aquimaris TaxID=641841 RepID=A0A432XND6_9GAMM|nr:SIS domain-containing protein [Pseudidiomarina aquimaris]MBG23616.1 phosphoheptose isomerase [Idiomarinaceae bacterium]RUO50194.1 phosphoheptose isomerase [Pseudidiomarina aquimaris]|tara:strand:- start:1922 stop:2494 length:573 start_codon:yes stop_codon:yes gene_type:complete
MEEPVKAIFTECIQTQIASADLLQEPLLRAGELLVDSLLRGQKVYCCGESMAHASARHFSHIMLTGLQFDRPPFPVNALHADFGANEHQAIFAQQISAVGQPNDLLVVLSAGAQAPRVSRAMEAALSRGMLIVALTNDADQDVAGLLGPDDVEIRIPSRNAARVSEHLLQLVNMLCSLAEQQIFPQEDDA